MTTWKMEKHENLGEALARFGMTGLRPEFEGCAGYTWRSPHDTGLVYAFIQDDGIHVPIIEEEVVVQTVEEAEAILAVFVREEMGATF
jgi:hypothetical protein